MTEDRPDDRVKVRTTFRPDQELEVTRAEATDLQRQGLLKEDSRKAARTAGGSDAR